MWVDPWGWDAGRVGKQGRLKKLLFDTKQPRHVRGWVQQELNSIAQGKRKTIRNPPGHQLAHWRGYEANKGFGYEYSSLQEERLHKLQHKYDDHGKKNSRGASGKARYR